MTKLFVVRHAEHVQSKLTEKGSLQAESIAQVFKNQKFPIDAIYCSPLCTETMEIIADELSIEKIIIDPRLKPWDNGILLGLSREEVKEKLPDVYEKRFVQRDPDYRVEKGESLKERYERVRDFLSTVANLETPNQTLIVITHGGIIDDIFRIANDLPILEKTEMKKPYGCVSILNSSRGNFDQISWQKEGWAKADFLPRIIAESPTGGSLYLFPHQVGGSLPLLRGDRGELCKPATKRELAVYQELFSPSAKEEVVNIAKLVPKYLGTVEVDLNHIFSDPKNQLHGVDSNKSENQQDLWNQLSAHRYKKLIRANSGQVDSNRKTSDEGSKVFLYLVIENLTHGMKKPHVLDVKMGTRQHRDDETPDKIERKSKRCASTTSESMGFRINGFQAYKKSHEIYRKDKYWCRELKTVESLEKGLKAFLSCSSLNGNLPKLKCKTIVNKLLELSEAVKGVNWRFYGASILIVFDDYSGNDASCEVVLIDFGSCEMHPTEGNYDEGFVLGATNIARIFQSFLDDE